MLHRAGWHMQGYFSSRYVCRSTGGARYASSNLGCEWVMDAVYLHGQFIGQLFVVMDKQVCEHDQR